MQVPQASGQFRVQSDTVVVDCTQLPLPLQVLVVLVRSPVMRQPEKVQAP
ncbi:MAG: hypothetical protein RL653_1624 [Pseudomonadota bacterium]|jgi:hypothetical protein